MRWLNSITNSLHLNLSKLQEILKDRGAWQATIHGVAKESDRTEETEPQGRIILIQYRQCWVLKCSFNLPCDFHGYYFWTVVLEKTLESPLDCKEIKPVHPKGNQP